MTDNEKRAHDLTIFTLSQISPREEEIRETEAGRVVKIDFYKEYKDLYHYLLTLFNRDFPE